MKTTNKTINNFENQVISPTSKLGGDNVRTDITMMSETADGTPTGSWAKIGSTVALAAALAGGGSFMVSCGEKTEIPAETAEQLSARLHAEAEAEADRQGWSQGVRSLVAGVIDYYYYYPNQAAADAKQPLIRLSYQVDVADFIAKIEADAAARGTYDPKTEGFLQATVSSLEGDGKQNFWKIPSDAIYKVKADNKTQVSFAIGEYPSQNTGFNTINKDEGLSPNKEMQIYAGYGNKNWKESSEIVIDKDKRGELKNIL